MTRPGLSYEQAPPFGLPLRFFITAPLILLLAALLAIPWSPAWTASRWSPEALALTHLITLGFLGQVMMGALLQILPVVLGSPLPWPRLTARAGHLGLTLGTLLLVAGLAWVHPTLLLSGMAILAAGWAPFLFAAAVSLAKAHPASPGTLHTVRLAWLALLITLLAGFALAGELAGLWSTGEQAGITGLHAAWGLLGWVLLLVMGVAYQVVPMLQITPAYPAAASAWLAPTLLTGLVLLSIAVLTPLPSQPLLDLLAWLPVMAAMALFAGLTLDLLRRRRRKVRDATLSFWHLGMTSLLALTCLPVLAAALPAAARPPLETLAGLLFLLGFASSVVMGMLYKIVPFLAWFHLQTQTGARAGTIPNMKEFVPEARARRQYRLHLAAVLLLLPAPWLPPAYAVTGLAALAGSAWLLWRSLLGCDRLFRRYGGQLG